MGPPFGRVESLRRPAVLALMEASSVGLPFGPLESLRPPVVLA